MDKNDPQLRDAIHEVVVRYYERGERDEIVLEGTDQVFMDGGAAQIPAMLLSPVPHDEDFQILRAFTDPEAVILDIGANAGYSVASIWAVGSKCKIVSFEVLPWHFAALDAIAQLRPGNYGFRMLGLSDTRGSMKFVVPVVNGFTVSALSSASTTPNLDCLTKNIYDHTMLWIPGTEITSVKFWEIDASVEVLDHLIKTDKNLLGNRSIAAMKLDIEGFEYRALMGARGVLKRHKPLVMVEGGNCWEGLAEYMATLGYFYAEKRGMTLVPAEGVCQGNNGFYVHHDKVESYRKIGIYQ